MNVSKELNIYLFFSVLTGIILTEYVRRRRLTVAIKDIEKIIDIALKYRYLSPVVFLEIFIIQVNLRIVMFL